MAMAEYTYVKPRNQFGKQCVFEFTEPVAEECILPIPEYRLDYVIRPRWQCHVQATMQIAAHEVQTTRKVVRDTGMLHQEGGWSKEINIKDNDALQRYRRRIEKDDNWPISMKNLLTTMEQHILQNNTVNIYQNYFDDMIPTPLVTQYAIRVKNSYEDPQRKKRPIRCLSWSPNSSNRLAAAYSFTEFEDHSDHVNPYSYVWDIEDSTNPLIALKSSSPIMAIEFNPRDPTLLVSGLMSGQVCCWDIRMGDVSFKMSHPFFSHRRPVSQSLWITSKTNTEFFSSSTDGSAMWWDIRFLRKPTDSLLMDLEHPGKADILRTVGVTALHFEPTMSSRFLAGMENGTVVNVNRKTPNVVEKLATRFDCYTGPVVVIDRNPALTKNFLTIGDWSAKIWADDTREACLLTVCDKKTDLSGGCWSRSRCSVFYTINTDGLVEAYDLLSSVHAPVTSILLCNDSLTTITSTENCELLAVGSENGNIYLLECSDGLNAFSKDDRAVLSAYLDRCSRFAKQVDSRLKELLLNAPEQKEPTSTGRGSNSKDKKGSRERRRMKRGVEEKAGSETRRKSKLKRSKGKSIYPADAGLITVEENYFRMIEAVSSRYEELDEHHVEATQELLRERVVTRPQDEESDSDKRDSKKERKSARDRLSRRFRSRTRTGGAVRKGRGETLSEEELGTEIDAGSVKSKDTKKRGGKTLKSCPMKVCEPEICCMDMKDGAESKIRTKRFDGRDELPRSVRSSLMQERLHRKLLESFDKLPRHSVVFKEKMMKLKDAAPSVLQAELEEAKKHVRAWQEKAIARELGLSAVQKKIEENPEDKTEEATEEDEKRTGDLTKSQESMTKARVSRRRKSRRVRLTSEDIRRQKEEERKELWRLLKQKAKEQDAMVERDRYPRISAAFGRSFSEDVRNLEAK